MFGAVSGAQAADLADLPILRGSVAEGLSSSRVNWQGFYVGGQGDYGSITSKVAPDINKDLTSTFVPPAGVTYNWQSLSQAHSVTGGYGAFAGYNTQWDDVILGIEANYLHAGFRSTSSVTGVTYTPPSTATSNAVVGVSDFGSARLRAGYVVGCFLPYGFAGAGFGSQTVDRFVQATPGPALPATTSATKTKLVYGYSAGLGVDVMLIGGLFARAEYEYQRITSDIESNINTVRAGIGYKF
jgi:opacity protein-like surface antigen